ncbi:MAG: GNAT family N-acetyltransferase [Dehalococcoidales bacterium]|nr:GNAT family N-acetyltransferase [Dehalococcoidales bacterium]
MITGGKVRLREKRLADARDDYNWQSDPELAQLDATSALRVPFEEYLVEYSYQIRHPSDVSRHFSIESPDGKHIGNCTYYNINASKAEAEIGIMIGDRNYWDHGYGTDAIDTLLAYIFRDTNLSRIYLKTLDWNFRAQRSFAKSGFRACGNLSRDGHSFVLMEQTRAQWQTGKTGKNGASDNLRADRVAGG